MNTAARILHRIATASPTSAGLLAADLRLAPATIRRHVKTLIAAGRVEVGWDGAQLQLTDTEIRERAIDERVRSHR